MKTLAVIWLIHLKANSEAFRIFVKDDACFPATLAVRLLESFPAHPSSHAVQCECAGLAVGCSVLHWSGLSVLPLWHPTVISVAAELWQLKECLKGGLAHLYIFQAAH